MSEEKNDSMGEMQQKIIDLQNEVKILFEQKEKLQIAHSARIKERDEAIVKMKYIQELHGDLIEKLVEK